MRLKERFNNLCDPAKLYIVLATISIITGLFLRIKTIALIIKFFFMLIYTYFLNFLCRKGFKTVSWILVLLPYLFLFLAMTGILVKKTQLF